MAMHTDFAQSVLKYFIPSESTVPRNNIVKRHMGDLKSSGDYSFPIEAQKWKRFLNDELPFFGVTIFEIKARLTTGSQDPNYIDQFHQEQIKRLIEHSKQWSFPIERGYIQRNRCVLYLCRLRVFREHLVMATNPQYGRKIERSSDRQGIISGNITSTTRRTITEYRRELVCRVLVNLLEYSTFSGDKNKFAEVQSIKCGVAKSPDSDIVTADQYIQKRCTDAQLMAQHKYGVRKNKEQEYIFNEMIRKLGNASVTVDLLEVKYTSRVTLSLTNHAGGTSRGAAFIMYNSARIETLCDKFDGCVRQGYYPEMPDFENIDVTLLTDEYEWALMFHYIADFPNMISQALGDSKTTPMAPHLICIFLSGLAGCFSVYYRHRKILTENREHLLPSLYARMALVKCLRSVLNKSLALLNIEPVKHM